MRKPPYQRWRPSHRDHWLPNVLPGFETPSQVEARRLSRVRILRNDGTDSRALADKLANCSARLSPRFAHLPNLHAPGAGMVRG